MNVPALMATYQLRQREYLLRITRAMTSRLDLPSLLKLILSSAAEMVGCRAGLIVLQVENSDTGQKQTVLRPFEVRAVYNIPPKFIGAFEPLLHVVPPTDDAAPDESDGSESSYYLDLQSRVRQVEEELGITLGQVVGLPLLFENELLGIIFLFRAEYAFTEMDWEFLQGFAHQAAIAVRNARLYDQLETERSRLATIIDNSADGILILDDDRRVVVMNQALSAMVGMTEEEVQGRQCHEVLPLENVVGEDLCQPGVELDALGETGARCEGDLVRPGGGRVTFSITYTPLIDEDSGQLVNIIVSLHDITQFREEEEIKSTFTSIISHELKTPVALIKGYAQTLARPDANWDADVARQSLQIIEEESDRLEALIDNLLDVSRIQASGLRLDFSDVDIEALVRKVADAYQTQTDVHQIEVDFPHRLPLVWGDEERLRQVFTNLVGNALKYSPSGGLVRIGGWTEQRVDGRTEPVSAPAGEPDAPDRVVTYVADQGIGIPKDELSQVFERFYRVDSGLRRSTAGSGLGLFLAKAIVDAHNGQIWVRSEVGKGTTFFVALPVSGDASEDAVPAKAVVT